MRRIYIEYYNCCPLDHSQWISAGYRLSPPTCITISCFCPFIYFSFPFSYLSLYFFFFFFLHFFYVILSPFLWLRLFVHVALFKYVRSYDASKLRSKMLFHSDFPSAEFCIRLIWTSNPPPVHSGSSIILSSIGSISWLGGTPQYTIRILRRYLFT